jgi:hypothetical protein
MRLYQFLLTGALLGAFLNAPAQTTEQPDPLRPSQPDSTQTAQPDSTQTDENDPEDDEKELADTDSPYRYRLTADGTATRGNVNRFLLQLTGAIDFTASKRFKLSSNPSFVYGRQNFLLNEREWFGDFRTTFQHEKRVYYLAFGSFERSNLRKILSRWIVAAGVGVKIVDQPKVYLSLTNVLLHENTDYLELDDISVWRNSARLYGSYTVTKYLTISHTTFWQPALNQRGNVRWNGSFSMDIKMTNALSLRTTIANSYESVVVPGRVRDDLRWTMGLVYERK